MASDIQDCSLLYSGINCFGWHWSARWMSCRSKNTVSEVKNSYARNSEHFHTVFTSRGSQEKLGVLLDDVENCQKGKTILWIWMSLESEADSVSSDRQAGVVQMCHTKAKLLTGEYFTRRHVYAVTKNKLGCLVSLSSLSLISFLLKGLFGFSFLPPQGKTHRNAKGVIKKNSESWQLF